MGTVLKPILQPTPGSPPTHNFGLCETFSYIPVEGAGRPLYARASYITNFSDMSIHLSAGELAIGAVTIKDNNSGLNCDVVSDPDNGLNALRVITQDLESIYDDIAIGDKRGIHYATIDGPLSSLNVKVTNLSTLENSLQNQIILLDSLSSLILKEFDETQVLLLSSFLETNTNLSSFQIDFNLQLEETQTLLDSLTTLNQKEFNETQTLLDSLTSLQEDKQNQVITLLHQLTANTDELEINTDGVEELIESSNTLLNSLTSLNQIEFNETQTLLDSLTSLQEDKQNQAITLLHQLTSNTDNVESLIIDSNTRLDSLTAVDYSTQSKQDIIITLLDVLTAKDYDIELNAENFNLPIDSANITFNTLTIETLLAELTSVDYSTSENQNYSITLLHQLTSNTEEIEPLLNNTNLLLSFLTSIDYSTQFKQDVIITLLETLTANTDSLEVNTDTVESLIINSNTLLNSLTTLNLFEFNETQTFLDSLTSLQENKQNQVITLLHQLTSYTEDVETFLDSLTSLNQREFNETQTLLNSLTSLQSDKQDQVITLLHQLTSNTDELEINTDNVEALITESNALLNSLSSLQEDKQNQIITLLVDLSSNTEQLILNTDHLEPLIIESNTYLETLTGIDYATEFKQDLSISLFQILTGYSEILTNNTNDVETLLSSLTSLNSLEFNKTQNILLELSSLQTYKQNLIISLLESLTSVDYSTQSKQDIIITLLDTLSTYSFSLQNNTDNLELLITNSNTLLKSLTGKDYSTSLKQDSIITLLSTLTSQESVINLDVSAINLNTDEIEGLIFNTNTLLNSLTAKTTITDISSLETRLDVLTSTDFSTQSKQEEIISLLQILSGNTNDLENILENSNSYLNSLTGVLFATEPKQDSIITLLEVLTAKNTTISIDTSAINLNTDEIENLLRRSNTFLETLTGKDTITISNPVTSIEILNSNLNVTVLNPVTAVEVTNLNDIETKLDVLTSFDYASEFKQDSIITLLNELTANTNNTEELLIQNNTFLNSLTSTLLIEFDQTQTLLESLTSKENRQVEIVTLLNQLTANTGSIETLIDSLTSLNQTEFNEIQELLKPLTSINVDNPISLNDINGNNVTVNPSTSSLNVHVTNPVAVTVGSNSTFPITFAHTPNFDAFGRLRVSSPLTLFDSSHRYKDNNLWASLTSVGGSYSFNSNQGLMELTVNNLSGSTVIRETTKVFPYQPGKSLLVLNTVVMAPSAINLRQRVGYFGQDNGIYLQLDDGVISLVERSLVNGSPYSETIVPLSDWNGDKLDGTGPSGIVLDITKAQIFWMDIEWLGVGTVRCGFVVNGHFIVCHSFHHANLIASTYITTASLPLRYEITNKETTSNPHTLKQICSTVISEGGYELRGLQQAISIPITTPRTFDATNTYYPIISIKLKTIPDRLDAIVILTALSVLAKGNGINYNWQVKSSGITSGGSWVSAGVDSAVEYNITGTSYEGGRILASGFLNSSNQGSPNLDILKEALFKFQLERNNFTKTPYEITLVASADTQNGSGIFASMDWEEISR